MRGTHPLQLSQLTGPQTDNFGAMDNLRLEIQACLARLGFASVSAVCGPILSARTSLPKLLHRSPTPVPAATYSKA